MNVFTLNLKASDKVPFKIRMQPLVAWLDVFHPDVVFLQEVTTGLFAPSFNSAKYLKEKSGRDYHVTTAPMSFPPARPFFSHALGVLSLEKPLMVLTSNLMTRKTASWPMERFMWSSGSRAVATLLPTWSGDVWFMSVHIDPTQGDAGFAGQAVALRCLVTECARLAPLARFVIGGDFNFNPLSPMNANINPVYYYLITQLNLSRVSTGCTVNQTNNPYGGGSGSWAAPDHIYYSRNFIASKEEVVFCKPGLFVSDHAGVYVEFWRPGH